MIIKKIKIAEQNLTHVPLQYKQRWERGYRKEFKKPPFP